MIVDLSDQAPIKRSFVRISRFQELGYLSRTADSQTVSQLRCSWIFTCAIDEMVSLRNNAAPAEHQWVDALIDENVGLRKAAKALYPEWGEGRYRSKLNHST